MERRVESVRTERLERTKAAIASRLRPVCSHFPDEEFEKLVDRIAQLEIKYSLRADSLLRGHPAK